MGNGKRWVRVRPAGSTGATLLLARAVDDRQRASVGNQTGGRVGFFLVEPRALLNLLTPAGRRALEEAANACVSARRFEVGVDDFLLGLLDEEDSDVCEIPPLPQLHEVIT
jgi:hypothetical protein